MFSNRYIFIYSSVMVIIVAVLLSSAAMFLQARQQKNMTIAKIQGMLAALNIEASPENAEALYNKYIKAELAIDKEGKVVYTFDSQTDVQRHADEALKICLLLKKNYQV